MNPCPNCASPRAGARDEDPSDCAACRGELEGRALRDARRAWLYDAAFRALELARVYRAEEGAGGKRERGCLAEVTRLRGLLSEGAEGWARKGPASRRGRSPRPRRCSGGASVRDEARRARRLGSLRECQG